MKAGDSRLLKAEDAGTVINQASTNYQSVLTKQNSLIAAIYHGQSTKFELIRDSYMIQPMTSTLENVFPLVVGDKGNVLASISTVGDGRIAGYGYDVLAGFIPNQTRLVAYNKDTNQESWIRQTDHQPVFKRVLSWLVTGDPKSDLAQLKPSPLNIAWASLRISSSVMYTNKKNQKVYKPYASEGLDALKISYTNLSCDPLSDPVATCAANAQLVVIGAFDRNLKDASVIDTQLVRIKEIVKAKIPILYLNSHPDGGAAND